MELERQKASLLATNLKSFVEFVDHIYYSPNKHLSHPDKLFRLKLIVDEYRLGTIADELMRVNKHAWDERSSPFLIDRFVTSWGNVTEYMENNLNDLYIFSGRVYTLTNYCRLFIRDTDEKS